MDDDSSSIEEESSFEVLPYMTEDEFSDSTQNDLNDFTEFPTDVNNNILAENPETLSLESVSRYSNLIQPTCSCFDLGDTNLENNSNKGKSLTQLDSYFCPRRLSNLSLEGLTMFPTPISMETQDSISQVFLEDHYDLYNQKFEEVTEENINKLNQSNGVVAGKNALLCEANIFDENKGKIVPKLQPDYEGFKYISIEKSYPGKKEYKSSCKLEDISISICKWLRRSNIVQRLIERAKESARLIRTIVEEDLCGFNDINYQVSLNIILEESNFQPIRNGFLDVFMSAVTATETELSIDFAPVLPVGFGAALGVADAKIRFAKEHGLVMPDDVVISTSTFLFQAVPQRWHLATALCLNDLKNEMVLHNFTVSVPVPNQYVEAAKSQTSSDYMDQNFGFSVSLQQAHGDRHIFKSQDFQEFLCGYDSYRALRSAATVLAGLYKKYVTPAV